MATTDQQPREIAFRPSELNLGELCELEELTGESAVVAMAGMSAKAIRAVLFLLQRRDDPTYTYEQTAELTLSDIKFED